MSSIESGAKTADAKTWSPLAEIDMLMLMLNLKNSTKGHDWGEMVNQMAKLGWNFSREGLRKHFQATMTTKFSVKCEEGKLAIPVENDGAKVVRPKATPRKRSRKPKAGEADEDRSVDDDADPATPSKKPRASQKKKTETGGGPEKKSAKSSVQAEEKKKDGSDLSDGPEATAEESSEYGSDDKQG